MSQGGDDTRISQERLYRFVEDAFLAAGVSDAVAEHTARGLLTTSLRGVDSHGVRLLPHYLEELDGGRINPNPDHTFERTAPSIGRFDADHTYGHSAGVKAMDHAIDIASDTGVGHVSVRNSSHCGAMAYFGLRAAEHDMIGYATTHGTANTKTPGSTRPFFGNNPICVAAPMQDEAPFCFDSAMTPITFNEVQRHRDTGETLPRGTAADEDGGETRDPHKADQLRYIGDYKGFGLAMVGDVVNGLLSGMPVGRDVSSMFDDPLSEPRRLGHFFSAVRIDCFVDTEEFKTRLQRLADEVRDEPREAADVPVIVPGDPEKAAEAEREENGIPVPDHDLDRFDAVANELGVEPIARTGQPNGSH